MSDDQFTQTTLRASRADQEQAIAFRTIIENVFSGSGSDYAFGNDADNEIHAGAGYDLITGVQAMTHFWGNPITTRYLVKRGNPI
jgi:Ca2+-binding RTX toxin-like protein